MGRLFTVIENDTIRLLRECDAGVDMGVSAIADVMDKVGAQNLKMILKRCKSEHEKLKTEIELLLNSYHDEGKEPSPVAKGMSWIKTNVKMAADDSDATAADLLTDGCDMGTKSLSKYLNQYKAADEKSKDIAKRLIKIEEDLRSDLRQYL